MASLPHGRGDRRPAQIERRGPQLLAAAAAGLRVRFISAGFQLLTRTPASGRGKLLRKVSRTGCAETRGQRNEPALHIPGRRRASHRGAKLLLLSLSPVPAVNLRSHEPHGPQSLLC